MSSCLKNINILRYNIRFSSKWRNNSDGQSEEEEVVRRGRKRYVEFLRFIRYYKNDFFIK